MQSKLWAILFLALFVLAEYRFDYLIQAWFSFGIYIFEVLFVLVTLFFFKRIHFVKSKPKGSDLSALLVAFAGGLVVLWGAVKLGLLVPFDARNPETFILLLVIAPLLEEFLFRGAVWRLLENFFKYPFLLVGVTSGLFAFSHFRAIYFVPEQFKNFVLYQAVYALILGIACGIVRMKRGLYASIVFHFLFNLGFWTGCYYAIKY